MREPGTPSLDQISVFLTVVDAGSFAAAGRLLGRATSAVSYTIAQLELQLGIPLFDRERTRKPELTEAGLALLSEARNVIEGIDHMRAKVKSLIGGLEPEVTLVVDVMLPSERLVDVMQAFAVKFPTVTVRLYVEALGAITQLVLDGIANIGIRGPLHVRTPGIEQIDVGGVQLISVAAPHHPLARAPSNAPGMARNHTQLVLTDRSSLTEGHDFGVIGVRSWRLGTLEAKRTLLLAGIGWGFMPEPMVRDDIAAGRLIELNLSEWPSVFYPLHAIHRPSSPPGPAAAWMIRRFCSQVQPAASDQRQSAHVPQRRPEPRKTRASPDGRKNPVSKRKIVSPR